jgi:uncharacterized protein DUF3829
MPHTGANSPDRGTEAGDEITHEGPMNKLASFTLCAVVALSGTLLPGCKEDPPPPPATAATGDKPKGAAQNRAEAKNAPSRVPRISPQTTKDFRVDICWFGSQGLRMVRDAYMASLGGKEPTPEHLPSFGDFPELKAKKEADKEREKQAKDAPAGRPRAFPAFAQLPFMRHVRVCSLIKSIKDAPQEALDTSIAEFDKYATKLNKSLTDAMRYYDETGKQWEKDNFERGKKLHAELVEEFKELDTQLAAFGKGVDAWKASLKELPEQLDDTGKIAQQGTTEARAITAALLGDKPDTKALGADLEKLKTTAADLKKKGDEEKTAAYPKVVGPKLDAYVLAVEPLLKEPKLTSTQLYATTSAMTDIIEAGQRALAQLLRQRGDVDTSPSPMHVNPRGGAPLRVNPRTVRPDGQQPPAEEEQGEGE